MRKKRRSLIVLSSSSSTSEEEDMRGSSPTRRRSSASSSLPTGNKRSRKSATRDPISMRDSRKAEFDTLSEDFSECLHGLSGPGPVCHAKELWVEKYKPSSLSDFAVHKKKVEEVKNWLGERLKFRKEGLRDCTLLLTGQAGTSKSAAIHVVASEIRAEVCKWITPTPTLWSEHLHNTYSGL